MDLDKRAADLVRRLKLDFVPWEDEAPEKLAAAQEMIAAALRNAQEAVRIERGAACAATLSPDDLDSIACAFFAAPRPLIPTVESRHRAVRAGVAAYEAIRLRQRETVS